MAEPVDMIVPMLQQLRPSIECLGSKIDGGFGNVDARFDRVGQRLKSLEDRHSSSEQTQTAETLFGKLVTGDFEERIEALDRKVQELKGST